DEYLVKPAPREALWAALAGSESAPARKKEEDVHEKDPVNLDADLRATLPDFLRSRREALDELPQALAAGDREKFRRPAHKLASRYEVFTTSAPETVLAVARREKPQLILCDVDMPDVDGGDISSALFADDELRGIPVLFLTGLVGPAELKRLAGQLGGRAAVS